MSPPGIRPARSQTIQNHPAEAHRQDPSRRDVLVQCEKCGTKGTARIDRHGFTSRSIRAADSITLANRRWSARPGEKAAAALREVRRQPVTWHHDDCGGQLRSYDIGRPA